MIGSIFFFALTMTLLSAVALWLRPAQTGNEFNRVNFDVGRSFAKQVLSGKTSRFLIVYVWTLAVQLYRTGKTQLINLQIHLLLIRQALAALLFGRGILHS